MNRRACPRGLPFWYIRAGRARWDRYLDRYRDDCPQLLNTLTGPYRKGRPQLPRRLQRKNRSSARADVRIFHWLLEHHDARTGWVGVWDGQQLRELRFEAIARGCGVHPMTLKRELRKLRANGLIHRWQGRDHRPENKDQPWAGRVAVLRLTRRFFEISHCAEQRQRLLDRWRKQDERAQRKQLQLVPPAADPAAELAQLAGQHGAPIRLAEHFARRVRAELGRGASTYNVHRLVDGRLAVWAQRRPPPTPRPPGGPTPGGWH